MRCASKNNLTTRFRMGRYKFLSWYRLKSNQEHLFLKISASEYLDEQPETIEEAVELAQETIESTKEMHEILAQDNRILVVKLDVRNFSFGDMNFVTFMKYVVPAASQGMDIDRIEVIGAGSWWQYLASFLPKYAKERIVLT